MNYMSKEVLIDGNVETLFEAAFDDDVHPYDSEHSACNLKVTAFDMKLQSVMTGVFHELAASKLGLVVYDKTVKSRRPSGVTIEYAGSVTRPQRDLAFGIRVVLEDSLQYVETTFDGEKKSSKSSASEFEKRVEFLFDYATAEVLDWPKYVLETDEKEKEVEEKECELE